MLITIPGRPVPAVRMTQKSKWSDSAKKYLGYKQLIGMIARPYFTLPTKEQVNVRVVVFLTGKTTPMGMDGDVDNYLKSALDGLNKIAFVDDRQVMGAIVDKIPCQRATEQKMDIYISIIKPQ